jgi:hypothetical protein
LSAARASEDHAVREVLRVTDSPTFDTGKVF